jgi:hypothetical protein
MKSGMEPQTESTYSLPLALLLQILEAHGQTCTLWAEVPPGQLPAYSPLHTTCQAEVVVMQGNVHTCLLRERESGQVLQEGRNAFEQLSHCGQLQWSVRPDGAASRATRSSRLSLTSVSEEGRWVHRPPPQRVEPLTPRQLETLARKHRQVLLLANGQRDVETLARMTHCSPEQLETILDDLAAWHLIRFVQAFDGRQS